MAQAQQLLDGGDAGGEKESDRYDKGLLHDAVSAIAARCDGAVTRDDQGFNGQDTKFGKRAAATPVAAWSEQLAAEVWRMLGTYQRQLAEEGFDYARFPHPRDAPTDTLHAAREEAREHERRRVSEVAEVTFDGDAFHVHLHPRARHARNRIKAEIPGRRFDFGREAWEVPRASAPQLLAIADDYGWDLGAAIRDLLTASAPNPRSVELVERGGEMVCRFTAPYDAQLTAYMRDGTSLPGRVYQGGDVNEAPFSHAAMIFARDHGFDGVEVLEERWELIRAEREVIEAAAGELRELSKATEADPLPELAHLGLPPYPYQWAGIRYALRQRRVVIGDEVGAGKSLQAIGAIEAAGAYPVLCVVPERLRGNWRREWERALPNRSVELLYGTQPSMLWAEVNIIGYSVLSSWATELALHDFGGLVIDEGHAIKHKTSQRSQAAQVVAEPIRRRGGMLLDLTGTAITNGTTRDLEHQLDTIGALHRLVDLDESAAYQTKVAEFRRRYEYAQGGYQRLHADLRATAYVRREKAEVLPDLPEWTRYRIDLDLESELVEYRKAEKDLIRWIEENKGLEAADAAMRAMALARINTLLHLAGKAKATAAVRWISEFFESRPDASLLAFAHQREVQAELATAFSPVIRFQGGMSDTQTLAATDAFQNREAQLAVCSLMAASEGLTLTAADTVLLAEQGWTPKDKTQPLGRIHRPGQDANKVTGVTLVATDTIDTWLYDLVEQKMAVETEVLKGERAKRQEVSIQWEILRRLEAEGTSRAT